MIEILIPLGSFAMIFGIVYIVVTAKHRQNIAMIERGINPNTHSKDKKHKNLKDGLFWFLVPIGILVAYFFQIEYKMEGPFPYIIFGFLFMGLSLIISYMIERKSKEETNNTLRIEE